MSEEIVVVTIDDDTVILNSIVSVLNDKYKVRPFPSAEMAFRFLEKNNADVILLDCNMPPNMNGFQALEILKKNDRLKKIPVIFLTGETDGAAEVRALEMGAVDYLRKPFESLSLQTRVKLQAQLSAYQNNLEEEVLKRTQELHDALTQLKERDKVTLEMLAELSDLRDHDTGAHIRRTTLYSEILVNDILENPKPGYELSKQQGEDIIEALKLHDLGKIAIPDSVLLKPGRLEPHEFEVIKTHTTEGAKMLEKSIANFGGKDSLLETALDIVYGHHEKWNGTGYPRGISGEDIELSARIAAIADVFDALTSSRPYKKPFAVNEAFGIMYRDSGTHFDPYLIDILKRHEKDFSDIAENNR